MNLSRFIFVIIFLSIQSLFALENHDELNQMIAEIDQVLDESMADHGEGPGLVKSMLDHPVKKPKKIENFGTHTGFSRGKGRGVLYHVKKGGGVYAPYSGYITAIINNESHSTIMLNHGAEIYTILAGIDKVDATSGQRVYSGQKLGHVRTWGAQDPCVYFELKYNGSVVDPVPYMNE